MAVGIQSVPSDSIRVLTEREAKDLFDRQVRCLLNVTGDEFIRAWNEGKFRDAPECPEVVWLAMLMGFAS